MLAYLSSKSIWFLELNAARGLCLLLLALMLIDAKRNNLLPAFVRYSFAPFIVGLLIFEVIVRYPPATSIYFWLSISSIYYVAVRIAKEEDQKPSSSWTLTTALLIAITVYAIPVAIVSNILYLFHNDSGPSIYNGFARSSLFREVAKQFVAWLLVAFPLFLLQRYFARHRKQANTNAAGG